MRTNLLKMVVRLFVVRMYYVRFGAEGRTTVPGKDYQIVLYQVHCHTSRWWLPASFQSRNRSDSAWMKFRRRTEYTYTGVFIVIPDEELRKLLLLLS